MADEDNARKYRSVLVAFMSHKDEFQYDRDAEFTQEQLLQVDADDVVAFFNFKAYGVDVPSSDDRPKHGRSNSLLHYKKALSFFMPNRNHQWDEITKRGNPTKSQGVNDMIKRVKRFETRRQGAPSKARRPLRDAEFRSLLDELRRHDDYVVKYGIPALLCFQFHLIGRLDDCAKWMKSNLQAHNEHGDKAAKAKLCWSKNVHEERDAPWQHLFGCLNWTFCCILHIGLWLEVFFSTAPGASHHPFVFGFTESINDHEKLARRTRDKVYDTIRPILQELGVDDDALLGTHSNRKFASTWVRSNGISKDDKDHRGRWKRKRISDAYDDVELDYVDAKVAAVLCPSGVCNYVVKDSACSDDWIISNVTPKIAENLGNVLAVLFGKAILWLCFSEYKEHMPIEMRQRITAAYDIVRTLPQGENPIGKRLVHVSGEEGTVYMEDIEEEPEDVPAAAQGQPAGPNRRNNSNGSNRQLLLTILANQHSLQRAVTENSNGLADVRGTLRAQNSTMNKLIRKIDANPTRLLLRAANNNTANNAERRQEQAAPAPRSPRRQVDDNCDENALLFPNPKNLYQLWTEYELGIGTRKAAKFFTRAERGRFKFKYSRRKIVWDLMAARIRAGDTYSTVIDNLYAHYGPNSSVTTIINGIRQDRKAGSLPISLRV